MRICVLTPVYPPYASGMGGAAARIAEGMGRRGHKVTVISPAYRPSPLPSPSSQEVEGEEIFVRRVKPRLSFGNAAWMVDLEGVIPEDTDVVHVHWPFIGVVGALVRWKRRHQKIPIVITYHMDLVSPPLTLRGAGGATIVPWLKGLFFRVYVRWVLPKVVAVAEKIIVTSYDYARGSELKPLLTKSVPRVHLGEGLGLPAMPAQAWQVGEVDRAPSPHLPPHLTLHQSRRFGRDGTGRASPLAGEETSGRGGIVEIPLGVDTERFSPGPKDPALMARYCISDDDRVILFVGALDAAHAFKGIQVVLKAVVSLSLLRERVGGEGTCEGRNDLTSPLPSPSKERGLRGVMRKYKLLIVGDGEMRPRYERTARRLGIAERVIVAGRVSDAELPAHYRLADLLVLPSTSRSEAFGLVVLEAAACGVPAVVSDLPGVRALVEEGKTGWHVPLGDAAALAAAIQKALDQRTQFAAMGSAARTRVEAHYAKEQMILKYAALFQRLITHPS